MERVKISIFIELESKSINSEDDWMQLRDGGGQDGQGTWWPQRAVHGPGHFSAPFCMADDACFFYSFVPGKRPAWATPEIPFGPRFGM